VSFVRSFDGHRANVPEISEPRTAGISGRGAPEARPVAARRGSHGASGNRAGAGANATGGSPSGHGAEAVGQTLLDEGISGTPAYMAPEQARRDRATTASDWYAVGVFHALTGELPFEGNMFEIMNRKLSADCAAEAATLLEPLNPLNAAIAGARRGRLLGGDEGRALVARAHAVLSAEGIKNPDRWMRMVTPAALRD
jgi:serine/threonine protein kinase